MVNIQCKIMLNRCVELARARIDEAQTRHVGHRDQNTVQPAVASSLSAEQQLREQEKMSAYRRNKQRSMWEQEERQPRRLANEARRLDQKYYQQDVTGERSSNRTWVDFPEGERRLSTNNRPGTAKPCNDMAKAFISQLGS